MAGGAIRPRRGDHPRRGQQRASGHRGPRRLAQQTGAGRDVAGCADELALVSSIYQTGASYQRQRRVAEDNDGDLRAVVDALIAELVL